MYSYTFSGDQKNPAERSAGCGAVLNGATPIVAPASSCGTASDATAPVNVKRPGHAAASRSAAARSGPSPISRNWQSRPSASSSPAARTKSSTPCQARKETRKSEEHTSELQSREKLVCPLLLEKKKKYEYPIITTKNKKKQKTLINKSRK